MKTLKNFHVEIRKRNTIKSNSTGSFKRFLDLPINLRSKIYQHVLDLEGELGRTLSAHGTTGDIIAKRYPFHLPAVCLTSKSECAIACSEFLQSAKFVLCCEWCGEEMLNFLDNLPGDFARDAVRTLVYDHYIQDPYTNDRRFSTRVMTRLPQLKSLQIVMSVWDIIESQEGPVAGLYRSLNAHEILEKKDFRGIMKCTALTYVHFLVVKAGELHQDDVMEGFYAIGQDMYEAFTAMGRGDVRLRFTHYHRDDPRNDPSYSHRAAAAAAAMAAVENAAG